MTQAHRPRGRPGRAGCRAGRRPLLRPRPPAPRAGLAAVRPGSFPPSATSHFP